MDNLFLSKNVISLFPLGEGNAIEKNDTSKSPKLFLRDEKLENILLTIDSNVFISKARVSTPCSAAKFHKQTDRGYILVSRISLYARESFAKKGRATLFLAEVGRVISTE